MTKPDIEGAIAYARERLARELPAELSYHSFAHTFAEVLPAATLLAELNQLSDDEKGVITVAAAFHDIGWVVQGIEHEAVSAGMVRDILPRFDFTEEQIERIAGMILATRLPQSPRNLSEEIMADADLSVIGGQNFWRRSEDLRKESAVNTELPSVAEWLELQLRFMEAHHYFTAAASERFGPQKRKNATMLRERVEALNESQ